MKADRAMIEALIAKGATVKGVNLAKVAGVDSFVKAGPGIFTCEESFQAAVIDLLRENGYIVAHFRPAWSKDGKRMFTAVAADGEGFPDLLACHEETGRMIAMELKHDKNVPTKKQCLWANALGACGVEFRFFWSDQFAEVKRFVTIGAK